MISVRNVYWPRNVLADPREMPELRRALLDIATDEGPWFMAEGDREVEAIVGPGADLSNLSSDEVSDIAKAVTESTLAVMAWHRQALRNAQLIHVSQDMCDVLFSSYESIPDDFVLSEETPPAPYGLVVFSRPFRGIDTISGERASLEVDALLWGPMSYPDRALRTGPAQNYGYSIQHFRRVTEEDVARAREGFEDVTSNIALGLFGPLGRADWLIGDDVTRPSHDAVERDGIQNASMTEDRRLLAALWSLIAQKRVVQRTIVEPSKPARKRLDRAGDTTGREVSVIHLRRPEYRPTGGEGHSSYSVRWVVRPHWRNQAYGPGRSLRRLILVPPHVKGPPGAPIKKVEQVWALDQ